MWGIWRERNAPTFEGIERSIHDLKFPSFRLFEWPNASSFFTFSSLPDFLDFCTFISIKIRYSASIIAHCLCALVHFIFSSYFHEVFTYLSIYLSVYIYIYIYMNMTWWSRSSKLFTSLITAKVIDVEILI